VPYALTIRQASSIRFLTKTPDQPPIQWEARYSGWHIRLTTYCLVQWPGTCGAPPPSLQGDKDYKVIPPKTS
jgi:hypothetical protein